MRGGRQAFEEAPDLFLIFRCTMSQMTDVQLQTKENLARNFLEIARKILPGISRLKVGLRTRPKSG